MSTSDELIDILEKNNIYDDFKLFIEEYFGGNFSIPGIEEDKINQWLNNKHINISIDAGEIENLFLYFNLELCSGCGYWTPSYEINPDNETCFGCEPIKDE